MENRKSPVTAGLLRRQSSALNRYLPAAIGGDEGSLHRARVASRRLRESVPVLTSRLKGTKAMKASRKIRRLTRALGTVRELDVTLGLAEALARAEHLPRAAVEDVRAHILAKRKTSREVMLERLARLDTTKLNSRLDRVIEVVAESDASAWRDALASRIVRRVRALSSSIAAAGQMYAPEQLHRVRIASKKLRYALELAAETGTAGAAAHVRTIRRTQDLLGKLHDLQVLGSHVAAVQAEGKGPATPHDLERLANHIEGECRLLHGRYIASVNTLRDLCASVSAEVVPALARTVQPARSVKMTLPGSAARAAGSRR